jgi:hypothetical protein
MRSSRPPPRFRPGGARPPTQVIVDYITCHRDRSDVEPICAVLSEHGISIARSNYYARTKAPVTDAELAEAYLVNALVILHEQNWGVYGVRKAVARRPPRRVGRRPGVARMMSTPGSAARSAVDTAPSRPAGRTRRRDTRIWSTAAGQPRRTSTSYGSRTSRMCVSRVKELAGFRWFEMSGSSGRPGLGGPPVAGSRRWPHAGGSRLYSMR